MRVVLDTNVYISALLFDGIPNQVIQKVRRTEGARICVSLRILQEIAEILRRKFHWPNRDVNRVLAEIRSWTLLVTPEERVRELMDNPDEPVLACALEAQADFLVSGDKRHLLPLREFRGIRIVSPTEFLRMFDD